MAGPTHHDLLLTLLLFTSFLAAVAAAARPGGRRLEDMNISGVPVELPDVPRWGMPPATKSNKHAAREFLGAHNRIRRFVREAPYVWNRSLAQHARRWANERRVDCQCIHSGGPYGENMFWGTGMDWSAADAVRSWALEHYDYDPQNNSCRPGRMCGHYTQIVWNGTIAVGCARADCDGGGVIMVCNYDPPGNFIGESPFHSLT